MKIASLHCRFDKIGRCRVGDETARPVDVGKAAGLRTAGGFAVSGLCYGATLKCLCSINQQRCKNVCLRREHAIQWFSHGIFVLRPHFLRHRAAYLLHVPRMASWVKTRPRHAHRRRGLSFCGRVRIRYLAAKRRLLGIFSSRRPPDASLSQAQTTTAQLGPGVALGPFVLCAAPESRVSSLGQMSALPPKADIARTGGSASSRERLGD